MNARLRSSQRGNRLNLWRLRFIESLKSLIPFCCCSVLQPMEAPPPAHVRPRTTRGPLAGAPPCSCYSHDTKKTKVLKIDCDLRIPRKSQKRLSNGFRGGHRDTHRSVSAHPPSTPSIDSHRPGGTRCWAKGGVDSCRRPDREGPAFDRHGEKVTQPNPSLRPPASPSHPLQRTYRLVGCRRCIGAGGAVGIVGVRRGRCCFCCCGRRHAFHLP